MPIRTRALVLLLLTLLVSGCGFTLRGADGSLPMQLLSLEADRSDGAVRALRRQLESLGVTTQPGDDAPDHFLLSLENEEREARRTTVNTGTRGARYELTLAVDVSLSRDGETVAGPVRMEVQRNQDEDVGNLTSSDSERSVLYRDMEQELARRIIQQLRTLPAVGAPAS